MRRTSENCIETLGVVALTLPLGATGAPLPLAACLAAPSQKRENPYSLEYSDYLESYTMRIILKIRI